MGPDLRGDLAAIEVATTGAGACVPLVLGDDGRQRGNLGDLMPGRFGVVRSGFLGQRGLASGADRGHIRHDILDPVGRQPMTMRAGMPRLAARLASARRLDDRLGSPRRIGRRGRGGIRGVAVELAAEFVEFGLQPGDLLLGLFQDASAELAALRTGDPRGRRHLAHTLITIGRPRRVAKDLVILRSASQD